MSRIRYSVRLTDADRNELVRIISKGSAPAKMIMHANVLLAVDESPGKRRKEKEVAEQFHVHAQTVHTIRRLFVQNGLEVALGRKKRLTPPVPPKITGDVEARIIALSCGEPPQGWSRWTVRLLANKAVELEILDSISYESVHRLLKKTN